MLIWILGVKITGVKILTRIFGIFSRGLIFLKTNNILDVLPKRMIKFYVLKVKKNIKDFILGIFRYIHWCVDVASNQNKINYHMSR